MAGSIPELKDLEAALAESTDVESAQNAYHEYRKRGGLNNGDAATDALRKRVKALRGAPVADLVEHYEKDGLTMKPGKGEGGTSIVQSPSESQPGPLAPQNSVLPTPVITPAEMSAAIDRYNEHAKVLEAKPGYIVQIKGKPFRTKAFWRAIARIYSVSSARVSYSLETEMRAGVFVRTHTVTVRALAPNGKFADGMGQASNAEPNKKEHTDHMLSALAYTRATNRAISDLCGFGEPSAEEVEE